MSLSFYCLPEDCSTVDYIRHSSSVTRETRRDRERERELRATPATTKQIYALPFASPSYRFYQARSMNISIFHVYLCLYSDSIAPATIPRLTSFSKLLAITWLPFMWIVMYPGWLLSSAFTSLFLSLSLAISIFLPLHIFLYLSISLSCLSFYLNPCIKNYNYLYEYYLYPSC